MPPRVFLGIPPSLVGCYDARDLNSHFSERKPPQRIFRFPPFPLLHLAASAKSRRPSAFYEIDCACRNSLLGPTYHLSPCCLLDLRCLRCFHQLSSSLPFPRGWLLNFRWRNFCAGQGGKCVFVQYPYRVPRSDPFPEFLSNLKMAVEVSVLRGDHSVPELRTAISPRNPRGGSWKIRPWMSTVILGSLGRSWKNEENCHQFLCPTNL